jgi:hypothetical protein
MHKLKNLILLLAILLLNLPLLSAQNNFQESAKIALKSGDSQTLGRFCSDKMEFGLEGAAQSMNSRKAAEQLGNFFRENPPADAAIQFQGKGKDGRKYMICNYTSRNGGGYRISFYWKEQASPLFESIDISKD